MAAKLTECSAVGWNCLSHRHSVSCFDNTERIGMSIDHVVFMEHRRRSEYVWTGFYLTVGKPHFILYV